MDYEWSDLEGRYVLKMEPMPEPLKILFAVVGATLVLLTIFFVANVGPVVYDGAQKAVLEKAVDVQMKMDSIRETKSK